MAAAALARSRSFLWLPPPGWDAAALARSRSFLWLPPGWDLCVGSVLTRRNPVKMSSWCSSSCTGAHVDSEAALGRICPQSLGRCLRVPPGRSARTGTRLVRRCEEAAKLVCR
ncbi:hypothetical protein TRIUR3_22300 [Triticum urartu]|uniref:Uncharacterized protein n=1 Tax=Triticum urartu TaxID=4572 RepID=M7ZG96_TRIUA|nr:hypothetical protein TRIUR3_22300 [Triticum urartu]